MASKVSRAHSWLEPYCIGLKLRALRTRKRLTLARLAAETGLSTALLSKLETDRMIPTLPTLAAISRIYGVGLGYFFAEPARHVISITRKALLQGNGRGPETARTTPLNGADAGPLLAAEIIELGHGNPAPLSAAGPVAGVFYVLEGKLALDAGGVRDVLDAGDCLWLDSEMPLAWCAADKHRCRVLAVLARPH